MTRHVRARAVVGPLVGIFIAGAVGSGGVLLAGCSDTPVTEPDAGPDAGSDPDAPIQPVDGMVEVDAPIEPPPPDAPPGSHAITVTFAGDGNGRVVSSPAGLDCTDTCSASFAEGTVVTLTATADADHSFAGWSGACTGKQPCSVMVQAAAAVTAEFYLGTGAPKQGLGIQGATLTGIVSDTNMNTYATGYFSGSITVGTTTLASAGGTDIFVAKYGPAAELLWVKRYGGTGADAGRGLAVDSTGNVYVTGEMSGTVNFGGGNVASDGSTDLFVLKLDPQGAHKASFANGGSGADGGRAIAVDVTGGIVVTGTFDGPANFGSTTSEYLTSTGTRDAMVVRYSTTLGLLWQKKIGEAGNSGTGTGIALDYGGDIVVTGESEGAVDFGLGPTSGLGGRDVWFAKYSVTGSLLWAKVTGGTGTDNAGGIAITNQDDHIALTFEYADPAAGSPEIFVGRYTGAGDEVWTRTIGSPTRTDRGLAVAINSGQFIAVAGTAEDAGGFAYKFAPTGSLIWGRYPTGTGSVVGKGIAFSGTDVVVGGDYTGSVDPGQGTLPGASGAFVIRLGQ